MTGPVRLVSPRIRVIRDGVDEPLEVQTDNRDMLLWERTRTRHKDWPKMEDGPFKWMTFISWAAARRLGLINGQDTYEKWEASCVQVEALTDDEDDETGTPIEPGVDPG